MIVKEFIQMRRDRLTFGMMVGIPILQLILFGFAINSDPKHLPAALLVADHGPQERTLLSAIRNSSYFDFVRQVKNRSRRPRPARARRQFNLSSTSRRTSTATLLRGDRPAILVEADATDPAATGNALGALPAFLDNALQNDLQRPALLPGPHQRPGRLARPRPLQPGGHHPLNIVPGLLGVVLTMTMVDDHRAGHYAGTRIGHHGESALHAHPAL